MRAWVNARALGHAASDIDVLPPLATDGDRATSATDLERRLRAGAGWAWGARSGFVRAVAVTGEAEVIGHGEATGDDAVVSARRAWAEITTMAGQLSAGRTASTWGLGLLSRGGEDDPMQFGHRGRGNVSDRLQFAIAPAAFGHEGDLATVFPLALVGAWDRPLYDDLSLDGDEGENRILAVVFRGKRLQFGVYGVQRQQEDAEGLTLQATSGDVFVAGQATVGDWKLGVSAEMAMVTGRTTWLRTPTNPVDLQVGQFGGVLRGEASQGVLKTRLEFGLASGDSRPFDDTIHAFKFASDYRIGLVLFPVLVQGTAQATMRHLQDPRFTGKAPAGVGRLRTLGSVTQAMYVHPVARLQAHPKLALLGGLLWARSPLDVAEPFRTSLNGGVPTGPRGAIRKRNLGFEADAGLEFAQELAGGLKLVAEVQGGLLLPGDAYDDADGNAAAAVGAMQAQLRVDGSW